MSPQEQQSTDTCLPAIQRRGFRATRPSGRPACIAFHACMHAALPKPVGNCRCALAHGSHILSSPNTQSVSAPRWATLCAPCSPPPPRPHVRRPFPPPSCTGRPNGAVLLLSYSATPHRDETPAERELKEEVEALQKKLAELKASPPAEEGAEEGAQAEAIQQAEGEVDAAEKRLLILQVRACV